MLKFSDLYHINSLSAKIENLRTKEEKNETQMRKFSSTFTELREVMGNL